MKTYSNTRPAAVEIINTGKGYAEVLLAENINEADEDFVYDLYQLLVPYRENLYNIITQNFEQWLKYAKAKAAEVIYTAEQLLQQEITELTLENIQQGQAITDLELMILEG